MLEGFQEQVVEWARTGGLLGLVLAMTVENLVQVVPSLVILPLAGHLSALGVVSLPAAMAASIAGSLIGCLIWYGLGRVMNEQRLERLARRRGRLLGLTPERLQQSRHWFQRHGWQVVCWGRLIPVLRTNVSLPAGIELMPLPAFLGWSLLGSSLWNSCFILVGYGLTRSGN
ncbi:DedA family protein [Vulcanococcus sp. Clear-D1]|uniref:DedA family protein n=1 Tax=Vulcanococcus sp. Clear-D1 TaxID=2766970 RepID=UPI0019A9F113|nr:DedA family protein [Vulcanococcus sp. Clear-D1]MBD1193155.1 DedA family protein [Vulcanococcus sp. Clear-D1]